MKIFKRNGDWWADLRPYGGRKKMANKKDAQEVVALVRSDVIRKRYNPGGFSNDMPFVKIADKFVELHVKTRQSTTWGHMFKRIRARFAEKKMGQITTADVIAFHNEEATRASPSTANKYLALLRSFFNRAKEWGDYYGESPCAFVKKKPEPNPKDRYLTKDQMVRLLEAAHPRLRPVVACALLTGMRRGEILNLDWQDVNLQQKFLTIMKSKSGKRRDVPIASNLYSVFMALGPKPEGNVFNLPVISLRKYYGRALNQAKIKDFRKFHDLRHTFGSWFMMMGGNIYVLQKLLGHSTIKMTERYAHLSPGHMAANMANFESAIPIALDAGTSPDLAPIWHQPQKQEGELVQNDIVKSEQSVPAHEDVSHAF